MLECVLALRKRVVLFHRPSSPEGISSPSDLTQQLFPPCLLYITYLFYLLLLGFALTPFFLVRNEFPEGLGTCYSLR